MRLMLALAVAFALPAKATEPPAHVDVEFLMAEYEAVPFLIEAKGDDGLVVYVAHDPFLTNKDVASASTAVNATTRANEIRVVFTAEGKQALAEVTATCVGKPIAITINGKLVAAPRVMEPITGGEAVITGNFTAEEAQRIAAGITPPASTQP